MKPPPPITVGQPIHVRLPLAEQPTVQPCDHHYRPCPAYADHGHCSRCGLAVWPDTGHECPPAFTT